MQIVIVRQGNDIKQVFLGNAPEDLKLWISNINSNPLNEGKWSYETSYTSKTMWDLIEFLQIS